MFAVNTWFNVQLGGGQNEGGGVVADKRVEAAL